VKFRPLASLFAQLLRPSHTEPGKRERADLPAMFAHKTKPPRAKATAKQQPPPPVKQTQQDNKHGVHVNRQ
jgi:hypothetical protein